MGTASVREQHACGSRVTFQRVSGQANAMECHTKSSSMMDSNAAQHDELKISISGLKLRASDKHGECSYSSDLMCGLPLVLCA